MTGTLELVLVRQPFDDAAEMGADSGESNELTSLLLKDNGGMAAKSKEVGSTHWYQVACEFFFFSFSRTFLWSQVSPDRPQSSCQQGSGYSAEANSEKFTSAVTSHKTSSEKTIYITPLKFN